MKAEVFVKKEAKDVLSRGNWFKGVLSIIVTLFIPVIAVLITELAYSFVIVGGEFSEELLQNEPVRGVIFAAFSLLSVLSVVFLSPLYNGGKRVFASMAYTGECRAADIFYFFENKKRYLQAVGFNLSIIVRALSVLIISLIPGTVIYAANESLAALAVILVLAGILFTVGFIHRYSFASILFSYHDYTPKESLRAGAVSAKYSTKSLIKLTVSFWLLILSLFFVVPFVFVLPYMSCAYCVSAKYLFTAQGLTFETDNIANRTASGIAENGSMTNKTVENGSDACAAVSAVLDEDSKTIILEDGAVSESGQSDNKVELQKDTTKIQEETTVTENSATAVSDASNAENSLSLDFGDEDVDVSVDSVTFGDFSESISNEGTPEESRAEE